MTAKERIKLAAENADMETDNVDKLIALAYYMGREEAAKEICDSARHIFEAQLARANECRYHKMAHQVQGGHKFIYSGDYGQAMTGMFGNDKTNV